MKWMRENVFPHEEFFKGCAYREVRCFGEWTNTVLEGTNCGLKRRSCFSVAPNMPMDVAVKNMILQDEAKARKLCLRAATEVESCCTAYASHPLSRVLCDCALSEVSVQMKESRKYASVQIHPERWLVFRGTTRANPESGRPLPVYVRIVSVSSCGHLMCSCGHFQQNGFPCRHMLHVLSGHLKQDLVEGDFDVRLWRNYAHVMVVRDLEDVDDSFLELKEKFLRLSAKPIPGPVVVDLNYDEGGGQFPCLVVGEACEEKFVPANAEELLQKLSSIIDAPLQYANYEKEGNTREVATATAEGYTQETSGDNNDVANRNFYDDNENNDMFLNDDEPDNLWFGRQLSAVSKEIANAGFEAEKKGHSQEMLQKGYDMATELLDYLQKLGRQEITSSQIGQVVSCYTRVRNPERQHKKQKLAGLSQSKY